MMKQDDLIRVEEFRQSRKQIGNVLVLVSEKGKGYLIGEFRRNPNKGGTPCRNKLRQLPM